MFHPLIKLLVAKPQLLAEHLAGYAHLLSVQADVAVATLRRRVLLLAALGVLAGLGLGLMGVALLLAAALPVERMPAGWMLVVVPAVPLLLSLACWLALRSQREVWNAEPLRTQMEFDLSLLDEAARA